MKIVSLQIIALITLLALPVAAEQLPVAKPEEAGMSSQRMERIGQALRAEIDKGMQPTAHRTRRG